MVKRKKKSLEILFLSFLLIFILVLEILQWTSIQHLTNQFSLLQDTLVQKQTQRSSSTQQHSAAFPLKQNINAKASLAVVEKRIPIVAVSSTGEGTLGNLTVKVIPGNNNVLISTNPFLEPDLQYSANKAVIVAKLNTDYHYDRDFLFTIKAGDAQLVGGESAGAAMTIATIAALENKPLKHDAVITGTINPDGTIGRVGGIIEKAMAVAQAGYKYFLVPKGQATITYYEKELVRQPLGFSFEILNTRYVPKTIDLKKIAQEEWGLTIVEVETIQDALPYFINE